MEWTKGRFPIYLELLVLISMLDTFAAWVVTRKFPAYRYLIIQEDQLVENLSAIFFFLAFLLALFFFLKLRPIRRSPMLVTVAAFSLACFLDEISFGERLFQLSMPVVDGVKLDAIHDVIELVYVYAKGNPGLPIAAAIGISAPILWRLRNRLTFGGEKMACKASRLFRSPSTWFVLIFVLSLSMAILIDMDIFHGSNWYRRLFFSLEEVFEMNAAFTAFFFSFYLYESGIRSGMAAPVGGREVRGEDPGQQAAPKALGNSGPGRSFRGSSVAQSGAGDTVGSDLRRGK